MSDSLASLRKNFSPLQKDLEVVQACIQDAYKARHDDYMRLHGELRALRETAPHRSELEGLLSEFLETFLSAEHAKFDQITSVFKANIDPAIERKTTLGMFYDESNRPTVLWTILAPTLRESVKKAAQSVPWPESPEPAVRLQKISDLEQKISAIVAEMDELQGMASGMILALTQT